MPSPIQTNAEAIGSSAHFVVYTGAIVNTNLSTEGGGGACRRIRATGAGNLVVKRASDGANVILPFLAGETIDVQALELVAAGSTVVGCTVFW